MEYLNFLQALYLANVRYLLCGGMAVNIYGVPRMTADVDILIDFEEENVQKFAETMVKCQYFPIIPLPIRELVLEATRIRMIKEKNLIAYSYHSSLKNYMNLDVLIDVPLAFNDMWNDREIRKANTFEINVVSIEHLISLKQYANRIQDQQDVLLLSKMLKK